MTLIVILLGIGMVVAALAAVYFNNLIAAVVAGGIVSLFASVVYLILAAPDVAMTEAAIGAGLSTAIFIYAVKKTREQEVEHD
ncbi:hydrogenase subunit MbhD domain-containing protein [Calditrichota bacterium LG25]